MFAKIFTTGTKPTYLELHVFGLSIPLEFIGGVVTILLLLYAIRTFVTTRKSNELQTVPVLIVKYRQGAGTGNSTLDLVNLTEKLAYNIEVYPVYLTHSRDGGLYKIKFSLKGRNYIKANESLELTEYKLRDGAEETTENFARIISHVNHTKKHPLLIRFEDSQGIAYYTKISFERGDEKIVQPPKKLTRWANFKLIVDAKRQHRKRREYQIRKYARVHPDLQD